jgi:Major Facilitator Superfamily
MSVIRILRRPALRRIMLGMLVSALGDGMSAVAVAWLAVQIAPSRTGVWTGLSVAAYTLPATVGAVGLARFVRVLPAVRLIAADALLRGVALGAVAVLAVTGRLDPIAYVVLLAVSSLLHAWGNAGAYTLMAESLPEEDRVSGNAIVSMTSQAAVVVGPALAGGLTALVGPGWVIAADALTFFFLAWMVSRNGAVSNVSVVPEVATSAWRTISSQPRLLGLLVVTCVFFFLYGPVEVALPIHVAQELHGSSRLLGLYWAVFGAGSTIGGLTANFWRHRSLWAVIVVVIVGWGAGLIPLGLTWPVVPGLIGFGAGALIFGPYVPISMALFQQLSPPAALSRALAVRAASALPSIALGTLLGGPLVSAVGGRRTLLISAVSTIALGALVAGFLGFGRLFSNRLIPEPELDS